MGGPTASGKTTAAIKLAQHYNCSIISADSRQVYKETTIGTAKATAEEQSLVTHHMIDEVSIHEDFSVGAYVERCLAILEEEFKKSDVVVMAGGSGLYIKALTEGIDIFPDVKEADKEYYNQIYATEGIAILQEELKAKDPSYFESVDKENPHRLIRALSLIKSSGQAFSSFLKKEETVRDFQSILIALERPREELYDRINLRVDIMMEEGLLDEVKALRKHKHLKSLNTVGYKELFSFLDGDSTLEYAIDKIKQHSRNYAKRQITWFKNQQRFKHFHPESTDDMIQFIEQERSKS